MFELGQPHFVILMLSGSKYFVGVHLYQLEHLVKEQTEGSWSYGQII